MKKRNGIIISFTNIAKDSRVNRQIEFIKDKYDLVVVGMGQPNIEGIQYIHCHTNEQFIIKLLKKAPLLFTKQYEKYYWAQDYIQDCYNKLMHIKADFIIANDIDSLPVSIKLSNYIGAKVIYDAHEYSPRQFEDRLYWRILFQDYTEYLCKSYLNKSRGMMTVCEGLSNKYNEEFNVESIVVTNAPNYCDIPTKKTNNDKIRLIHHGAAISSRKLENMIKMMEYLDERFELDLMLVPNQARYYQRLLKMVSKSQRVRIIPPVPMQDIVNVISNYDIGIFLLEPVNLNYKMALPNKLFEFIQARLALAIGPSQEMERIVKKYDCGVVSRDFEPRSLAECLNKLDNNQIDYYKNNSNRITRIMSSESNKEKIIALLEEILI